VPPTAPQVQRKGQVFSHFPTPDIHYATTRECLRSVQVGRAQRVSKEKSFGKKLGFSRFFDTEKVAYALQFGLPTNHWSVNAWARYNAFNSAYPNLSLLAHVGGLGVGGIGLYYGPARYCFNYYFGIGNW